MAGRGRKGRGHLQRAEAVLARNAESGLALYLKDQFLLHAMPASQVQTIAYKSVHDHDGSPAELVALAELGTSGAHPSNCHEELKGIILRELRGLPRPMSVKHPMRRVKPKPGEPLEGEMGHSFMRPGEWFHWLHTHFPVAFSERFLGCPDGHANPSVPLRRFWDSIPHDDPRKREIAAAMVGNYDIECEGDLWNRAVPIIIHGDGVPVGKMSLDGVSWSGFLGGDLSTLKSKILISGLLNRTATANTKKVYWSYVLWGLLELYAGKFYERDCDNQVLEGADLLRAGSQLAGGLLCVVWVVKGDMDWFANTLKLEGASGVCICPWCLANTIEDPTDEYAVMFDIPMAPWNDLAPDAVWRGTRWHCMASWLRHHGGWRHCHPLFLLPGLCILMVMADVLHVFDLGITHHVLGNVFFHLCYELRYFPAGATPQARLDLLWQRIVRHYRGRGTPCQLQNLTLSMFCNPKAAHAHFPCMSGLVKAAESRHLVPVLTAIFETLAVPGNAVDATILRMLQALTGFYAVLEAEPYIMSPAAVASLQAHVATLLEDYRSLCSWACTSVPRLNRWHEVPKHHYGQHVADQATLGNPKFSWCYSDEDFMGYLKLICEACTQGTAACNVVGKLLEKWSMGVALRLSRGM